MQPYEKFIQERLQQSGRKGKAIVLAILYIFLSLITLGLYWYSPYLFTIYLPHIIIGFISGILVFSVNYLIGYVKNKDEKIEHKTKISLFDDLFNSIYTKIIFILLLATIEEYIFRSYFLSFTNIYMNTAISIIINVVGFYLVHYNKKIIELMLMSTVFCLITIYTNNILPAIIAHSVNNILALCYKANYVKKTQ